MTLNNVVMPIRPSSNITMVPGFNLKIAEIWVLNSKPTFNLTFNLGILGWQEGQDNTYYYLLVSQHNSISLLISSKIEEISQFGLDKSNKHKNCFMVGYVLEPKNKDSHISLFSYTYVKTQNN